MTLTFEEYQESARATAKDHPDPVLNRTIWFMGVAGEGGETLEKWKKILAYKDGVMSDEDFDAIVKEMGDVLWYLAVLAHDLDTSLGEIATRNLDKLAGRDARGTIKGAGDER